MIQKKSFSLNEEILIEDDDHSHGNNRRKLFNKIVFALPILSKNYRDVILKRFFESKSIKEVAEDLNISVTNVTTTQNRALNKLREVINEKL